MKAKTTHFFFLMRQMQRPLMSMQHQSASITCLCIFSLINQPRAAEFQGPMLLGTFSNCNAVALSLLFSQAVLSSVFHWQWPSASPAPSTAPHTSVAAEMGTLKILNISVKSLVSANLLSVQHCLKEKTGPGMRMPSG